MTLVLSGSPFSALIHPIQVSSYVHVIWAPQFVSPSVGRRIISLLIVHANSTLDTGSVAERCVHNVRYHKLPVQPNAAT